MTMFDLDAPPKPHYPGKYKGYVRDNQDPEKRGRLRLFIPQVMGPQDDTKHWTDWALPCLPWLGGINTLDFGSPYTKSQNGGIEIGVWVEFEGGNPDFPIWVGTWIPAPTPTDPNAQADLSAVKGDVGGSIIPNPPTGSTVTAINPPKPDQTQNETRLVVKKGRELVIMCDGGGSIMIGPYGVNLEGVNVMINGKTNVSSSADKLFG